MKPVNLLSFIQAKGSLDPDGFSNYLELNGIEIKDDEIEDIRTLLSIVYLGADDRSVFNSYFIGYKIPQIGKEFDLLRFGEDFLLNIEIKSSSTEEKILKQLQRNNYYLSYICNKVYNITFVSSTSKFYMLDDCLSIKEVDSKFLIDLMSRQNVSDLFCADILFDPSNYLVSPFNSTDKFIDDKYFLTNHQEKIKNLVIRGVTKNNHETFTSITGSAGTGKTLLVYDLAKTFINEYGYKVLIVHCGYLNEGQHKLNENGWSIKSIRNFQENNIESYDLVIIDEAQRIYPYQLSCIIESNRKFKKNCIFSYDKVQVLSLKERKRNIDKKISEITGLKSHKLSEKIRTNKEISAFIKMIFNNKRNFPIKNSNDIIVNYFDELEDAKGYIDALDANDWKMLGFTPSQYNSEYHKKYSSTSELNSHRIIGQEYDATIILIDKYFYYDSEGELSYRSNSYYHARSMLFQNMTRARKKINMVIVGNPIVFNRCVSILKKDI